jgi:hypothetical protein
MKNLLVFPLLLLLTCANVSADPVVHKFEYWGSLKSGEKVIFYGGWTNGFFAARGAQGEAFSAFAICLSDMSYEQATAMIDKYYKDHPEHWNGAIGAAIVEALTVAGAPCEGKNPLK